MLIGGVTLVMAMFYLVQHPDTWLSSLSWSLSWSLSCLFGEDLDVRFYSWNILTLSACIFIAVLASDVVNQCAKRFLFSGAAAGWGSVVVDLSLAVCWFLASQLITALLSGAFGEEAKEPKDASSEKERRELEDLWEQRETAMCFAPISLLQTIATTVCTVFYIHICIIYSKNIYTYSDIMGYSYKFCVINAS